MSSILYTLLITFVLLLICLLAMAFKVFFIKGGRFTNTHIGGSKALKERGVNCATSQDREAQRDNKLTK